MKVSIGFGAPYDGTAPWQDTVDYVVEAEKLKVGSAWSAEAWGADAVSPLAYLSARTERIKLGTGIIQAGTRTPALVAMTAAAMQHLSGGRFLLGLGTSGPQVIEGWHGVAFERPLSRLKEIVDIVRLALSGEKVRYAGAFYELPRPDGEGKALRLGMAPVPPIPLYLATLGPRSLQYTGAVADGWLGTSFLPEHSTVVLDQIRHGAEKAGRSLADLDLHAGGVVEFGDDLAQLLAPRRPGVAFTLGAMGSKPHNFYNDAISRAGFADLAARVQDLWIEGKRDEAAALVPDELILQSNLVGTEEMVKARIQAYRDCGITTIRVAPAGSTIGERLATLGRFMDLIVED
ncbi:MAG: LLM class flavin-dependent oxidoreductase [Actinobacteria bacterium]|nr:LLM class flavin-dependent oxidoreductase [Actinomycetota bacterium]